MIGYLFAGIALLGSSIAAIIDLKTTEVPDNIPYTMAASAVVLKLLYSIHTNNFSYLVDSVIVGMAYLIFGFLLYYTGQWGGGDAKVLAAIGFLLPSIPSEFSAQLSFAFPVAYLINLFFIGSIYMIVYSLALTLLNPLIAREFFSETRGQYRQLFVEMVLASSSVVAIPYIILNSMRLPHTIFISFIPSIVVLSLGMIFLLRFLKVVERVAFRRKIPSEKLREGDMIGDDIDELGMKSRLIRGITNDEVAKIRLVRKEVWVKEGVRFVPAFPLSLIAILFFGDMMAIFSAHL